MTKQIKKDESPVQVSTEQTQSESGEIKRNRLKKDFKQKGDELDAQKPPMSKEETIQFYNDNIPFMKMQDEYEELMYRFHERKVKNLELQVREVEAVGYLSQWKAGQDDAKRRADQEAKMKEEWEKMSPEEKEEYKKKAQANLKIMEMQAAGFVLYNGENAHEVMSFINGESVEPFTVETEDKHFSVQIPSLSGGDPVNIKVFPGQKVERTMDGGFIVTE